jgi:polyisoprenoid-binding protein YceI
MVKRLLLAGVVAAVVTWQPSFAAETTWSIDPMHSSAQFSVRHMMISNVTGDFGKVSGTANYDGEHLSKAAVDATIPVANITTREPKRDEHLKSPDFFNVEKYPTMTFKSKKIESVGKGEFKMVGDLTIHGVTKTVVLDGTGPTEAIKDPYGKTRIGASAKTTINRKDFGLSYNQVLDNGGAMVGDDVVVTIDIEMVKDAGASKPVGSVPKNRNESI